MISNLLNSSSIRWFLHITLIWVDGNYHDFIIDSRWKLNIFKLLLEKSCTQIKIREWVRLWGLASAATITVPFGFLWMLTCPLHVNLVGLVPSSHPRSRATLRVSFWYSSSDWFGRLSCGPVWPNHWQPPWNVSVGINHFLPKWLDREDAVIGGKDDRRSSWRDTGWRIKSSWSKAARS